MSKKTALFNEQYKITSLMVLWRIPTFITSFVAACASSSIVIWLEFLENASIILPGVLLLIFTRKLNKNLKFKYNYGTDKVESVTALCCEMFDLSGLFCISIFAVRNIIKGSEKGDFLLFALVVSILGLLIDTVVVAKEKKLVETSHSRLLHTAYVSAEKEFVFDVISILTLIIDMIFAETVWISYLAPVVTLFMTLPFSAILVRQIKKALAELTDLTLDEGNQVKILKILSEFYESYDQLGEVRSRKTSECMYVDIELSFPDEMNYARIKETVSGMKERLTEELGKCVINVIIL